jgi:FkbM family methyltransferase
MIQSKRRQKSIKKNFIISLIEEIFRSTAYGYGLSRYLAGKYFYKYLGESDFEFFKFVNKKQTELFLDVGANDGISALTFRLYNQDYKILSLEPDSKHNDALNNIKKKDKNFEFQNIGLGNKKETKKLYIPECNGVYIGQLASLIKDEAFNNVPKIISQKNISSKVKIIEKNIEIKTIDSMNLQPEIIKIDVEGFESQVLEGGIETIKKKKPFLMIEINEVSVKKVGSILLELGYLVFTYDKSTKKLNSFDLNSLNLEDFVINIICINKDRKSEVESLVE